MESYNFTTGIVVSTKDESKSCRIQVKIPDYGGTVVEAIYTSPFFTLNGGGVLAIPDIGSEVLLLVDESARRNYYLATIVDYPENEMRGGKTGFNLVGDSYVYSEREIPQKVLFTNQTNAGLKITRKALPRYINSKVDIDSENGKRISLNDSPNANWVCIRNEHGDGIVVASDGNEIHSERSIEVKSKGLQQYVSYQSGMNFYVIDGKDINIENFSTGAFSNTTAGEVGRYGNINIRSHLTDVSLVGKGPNSQIFITTPTARIQIESDGRIYIDSLNSIVMNALGDINLKSSSNVNIEGLNVNIKANANIALDSGINTSSKANGVNSVDGIQVHLNSGLSLPVVATPVAPPKRNDYGE